MKLAALACGNGLGHIKRLIRVLDRLMTLNPEVGVHLSCERWQSEALAGWDTFKSFAASREVRIEFMQLPVRWSSDASYYGDWIHTWHKSLAALRLEQYDLVISDNLHEPLYYSERVILSGSFLWPDVLQTAYPHVPHLARYRKAAEWMLLEKGPTMIVNGHFVMPSVREWTQIFPVGFIGFTQENAGKRAGPPRRILVAMGSSDSQGGFSSELLHTLKGFLPEGHRLFLSSKAMQLLASELPGAQPFDFNRDSLAEVDFAVIRPGLGTISDCVLARVPMGVLPDANPEIAHNGKRLVELGLGVSLDEAAKGESSPLRNTNRYSGLTRHFDGLNLHGEETAAQHLLSILGGAPSRS